MRIARAIGKIVAGIALLICLAALTGATFFELPWLSPIGSMLLSFFGPWLLAVPIVIGALSFWFWRTSREGGALLLALGALVASGWAVGLFAQVTAVAHRHGVTVNWVRAFALRPLTGAQPDADVAYGSWQGLPLRLLIYKPPHAATGKPAPMLLYIHGGGFTAGDRFESGANLRSFADHGWVALSIDYSLSSADRHLWDVATAQVGCAMGWIAAHAAAWGGDPARLALAGSSAGGNLAINAAYLANAGRLESSCGGMVPRVTAVSALYPPVDLAAAWDSRVPSISDMARRFNTYYLGGGPQQFPDRYRFVASVTHISAAAPPTLVIFGANDHLVPPDATVRFVQQAREAGVDIESIRFPFGEHAFNLNQFGIGNQFYLDKTEQFLSSHSFGALHAAP